MMMPGHSILGEALPPKETPTGGYSQPPSSQTGGASVPPLFPDSWPVKVSRMGLGGIMAITVIGALAGFGLAALFTCAVVGVPA